jgi:plastocyanin
MRSVTAFAHPMIHAAVITAVSLLLDGGMTASAFAAEHLVLIEGMKYKPESLTVKQGDTIVWKNEDFFPHTVTALTGGLSSPQIESTGSWKYIAQKKGSYGYICTLHPIMKGFLVVE